MTYPNSYFYKKQLKLSLPIMLGQVSTVVIAISDTLMVGNYRSVDLAGIAFAHSLFFIIFVIGMGIAIAIKPLVANAFGGKNFQVCHSYFQNSLILYPLIGVVACLILLGLSLLIPYMGQEEAVVISATPFVKLLAYSLIPLLIFTALKEFVEALTLTQLPMIVNILGSVINILLNYLLIYGAGGMPTFIADLTWLSALYQQLPELGLMGAGWATLSTRILMLLLMLAMIIFHPKLHPYFTGLRHFAFDKEKIKRLLDLGFPIGLQLFSETAAFSVAGILVGMISKEDMAAHQIVLNLASATFLTAVGLGQGTTVNIANLLGKGEERFVGRMGLSAVILVLAFMSSTAFLMLLFRHEIPWFFLNAQDSISGSVAATASMLFIVAGVFQLSDGLQVVAAGNLRGLEDTKIPTLITIIAYWLIAIPLGYILAFHTPLGTLGIWIGLCVGLTVSAALLSMRFVRLVAGLKKVIKQ
jgi:multidrug resistance protein, MATE family